MARSLLLLLHPQQWRWIKHDTAVNLTVLVTNQEPIKGNNYVGMQKESKEFKRTLQFLLKRYQSRGLRWLVWQNLTKFRPE